jgi:hypothetical protein
MKDHEKIVSLIWLIIGGLICLASLSLRLGAWRHPGPGLFPFLIGGGITIISTFQLITQKYREPVKYYLWGSIESLKRLGILIFCLIFFVATLRYLGFELCTFFFFLTVLASLGKKDFKRHLVLSLMLTACSSLVFRVFLMINLPKGLFGI